MRNTVACGPCTAITARHADRCCCVIGVGACLQLNTFIGKPQAPKPSPVRAERPARADVSICSRKWRKCIESMQTVQSGSPSAFAHVR